MISNYRFFWKSKMYVKSKSIFETFAVKELISIFHSGRRKIMQIFFFYSTANDVSTLLLADPTRFISILQYSSVHHDKTSDSKKFFLSLSQILTLLKHFLFFFIPTLIKTLRPTSIYIVFIELWRRSRYGGRDL